MLFPAAHGAGRGPSARADVSSIAAAAHRRRIALEVTADLRLPYLLRADRWKAGRLSSAVAPGDRGRRSGAAHIQRRAFNPALRWSPDGKTTLFPAMDSWPSSGLMVATARAHENATSVGRGLVPDGSLISSPAIRHRGARAHAIARRRGVWDETFRQRQLGGSRSRRAKRSSQAATPSGTCVSVDGNDRAAASSRARGRDATRRTVGDGGQRRESARPHEQLD